MGYNTTVVVLNDALDVIEKDPTFGKRLAQAIGAYQQGTRVDIHAGNHGNAAHIVECHHADSTVVITVGGNLGIAHASIHNWRHNTVEVQREVLKAWAKKLGMEVSMTATAKN